ncbi:MAG: PKD domain-containing protein [Actinobacteria bacterium]|nr:PKD domain-containing protein [Actinomycetota bacterium]
MHELRSAPRHTLPHTLPFGHALAVAAAGVLAAFLLLASFGTARSQAAVSCPSAIPVVNENQCKTGSEGYETVDDSPNLGGFPTQTSVNLGESVTLKIGYKGTVSPTRTAAISVYRMGYYGGEGGRLVNSASNVAINNDFTCEAMNETTGEVSCANWKATYTIPGTAFPASGVYMAKVKASTGDETQIIFTVRNDASHSRVLFVLPMATYEAYNTFGGTWNGEEGGKSLYFGTRGYGTGPLTGSSRAAKVSFDRPLAQAGVEQNWFYGPDQELLYWMEKQGYDISYTDDISIQQNPGQLLNHDTVVISGHSEYWSLNEYNAFMAAREAGVNIASFSSNTAYWKVRYENNGRTLVCYKTVEGSGSAGSGQVSQNDWGPDGIKGTADDAAGPDGIAGTADDNPLTATTTWRDNGAPAGDPSAPPGGRVGPNMPENQLFGIMYVGDNDSENFPLTIPAANGAGEFAGSPIWRNTGISKNSATTINEPLVGWEWDAVPTQAQYLKFEPEGVERVFSTNVQTVNDNSWIQDEGRLRNTAPPPGQPGTVGAVRYKAKSGAEVFASGTMYWARGLVGYADPRIQQATYNILSEMGEAPNTPEEGITLDPGGSNHAPSASFTMSQNPAKTATPITFDASASKDSDGSIVKYEWDLNGDGTFETTTTTPKVTNSYAAEGTYNVRLRVTDNGGATDLSVQTLTIINNQPPTASFTITPESGIKNEAIAFNAAGSSDPDGTVAKYEWDFDGNGTYESSSGSSPTTTHTYTIPGNYTVGLRVTDNGGKTATTTRPVTIGSGEPSHYATSVLATPGLSHYWRMGEMNGPTFSDSKGSSAATATGGVTFGEPGAIAEDTDHSAKFDGSTGAAQAPVNLAATHTLTVEFWLKWNAFENDDKLAMEFTNNFNENVGGFLVDPNAPQLAGTFGVAIGSGNSRNNVFFERPSAGAWHYYAFVINTAAPAAEQIVPYVDGKAVSFQKLDSGTGAGNFANSILNFMSRAAGSNFGAGNLDEVALYERALSAATIAKHFKGEMVEGTEGSVGSEGGTGGGGGGEEGPPLGGTGASYTDAVLATPGIADYWPLSEAAGPTIADTVGGSPLNATGEPTFGATGGVPGETTSSVKFDGVNDTATGPLQLGGQTAITVSFWMKWNAWANNDELAMEYTPNFNDNPGGFLVDPNSSFGKFAVSIGIGSSRNVALFERPTAGVWHHYAFVLNSAAPAAEQIVPYVDGFPVVYTKAVNGEGGPAFANSTLALMSRGGKELFGAGNLQDVAIFTKALSAATISQQHASNGPNGRPQATFTAPTTAKVGEKLTFDASGSKDPNGTIVKYEWDLDGNGSYETDTGTTPSVSTTYTGAGKVNVGLRVTDNSGNTGSATRTVTVEETTTGGGGESGPADYSGSVLGTPGLVDYWPLSETSGSVFADKAGTSPATMLGAPTLGVPGGAPGDTGTAASFNGSSNAASAPLQLGGQTAVTVEFWMKWDEWKNEDQLAFEYTPNFNDNNGGFLVDPNSSYGQFAVALGRGSSRNVALFARPSAGVWHHYAFVLDTAAAANEQIVPYVDGKPVAYTKAAEGTGAGPFANSTLYFMSRGGTGLWGAGDLQDVAVYDRPLSATQVANHFAGVKGNQPPTASFTAPASVKVGEAVTLDASASKDSDGTVEQYEWDLDGDGTFETSTGANPKVTRSFSTAGQVQLSLRVTDNSGATAVTSHTITVQPAEGGGEEGGGGNGSGTAYRAAVAATPGLQHFWSLGEKTGSTLADPVGGAVATTVGEPALGQPGAIAGDTDTSVGFDGINDAATAPLSLSGDSAITLEFWMKWNEWSNNDALAFEFTPNFNDNNGGFLVDPNSSFGAFAVGIGRGESRNVATFARPTAGVWHHYAFVLNTAAPAAEQIVPYVDGKPVEYAKVANGTGAGNFADATLNFMSRAGTSLNGAGTLDDVAIYGTPLSAATISGHYEAATPNKPPTASFTASPNPVNTNATVAFNASASKDLDGTITKYEWDLDGNGTYETTTTTASATATYATAGERTVRLRVTDDRGATGTATSTVTVKNQPPTASFTATPTTTPTGGTIALDASASGDPDGAIAKYEWDLDGNGTYETSTGTTPTVSTSFATAGSYAIGLRVTDNAGATATTTRTVTIQNRAPVATFTATPNPATAGQVVSFNGSGSNDPDGTITRYEWDLDGNGTFETSTGTTPTASTTYATSGERNVGLRVTDNAGATSTFTKTVTIANQPPTASFTATPTSAPTGTSVAFNASASKDSDGTIAKYEWDLDGNGTYETTTTTPTTSTTYTTPGARTVGLRVVDNSGGTATTTVAVTATNRAPTASFTATPNPVPTGTSVTYNAAASSDPDGTIAKYEWDLDGNGTYELNTGSTPSAISNYATAGTRNVGLRVTDNSGATATSTVSVTVQNRPPVASFTATPNPVTAGTSVAFSAAGSSDPDGTITKYEWDLDGNGTYETNTGTTNKTSRTYTTAATTNVGLRVTDNSGATSTTTVPVVVRGPYQAAVLGTPGLVDYWRLGETSGTTLADSVGSANATAFNGVALNVSHPLTSDTNTAATFDGSNDYASAAVNLSGTSKVTIEFWLRWNELLYNSNNDQVLELTNNLNNNNGGFLINPASSTSGGRFEVAIGRGTSRNNIYFTRPSTLTWHHYAIVIETTAAAANQIVAYVDGKVVSVAKGSSGTGAGNFANSTLYFMSRGGTTQFAPGSLDELAIYNTALSATQIAAHYAAR